MNGKQGRSNLDSKNSLRRISRQSQNEDFNLSPPESQNSERTETDNDFSRYSKSKKTKKQQKDEFRRKILNEADSPILETFLVCSN